MLRLAYKRELSYLVFNPGFVYDFCLVLSKDNLSKEDRNVKQSLNRVKATPLCLTGLAGEYRCFEENR